MATKGLVSKDKKEDILLPETTAAGCPNSFLISGDWIPASSLDY